MPHMNLYDDGDFISTFLESIQIKNYLEWGSCLLGKDCRAGLDQKSLQKSLLNHLSAQVKKAANGCWISRNHDKKSLQNRYAEEGEAARADLERSERLLFNSRYCL